MANSVTTSRRTSRAGARPRLAVVVANGVTGDSRVEKTAIAAARAGWDVTLVGRSASGSRETGTLGGVTVVKVPVATALQERTRQRARAPRGVLAGLARWDLPDARAKAHAQAAHASWVRERTTRVGWLARPGAGPAARLRAQALKGWVRLARYAFRGRLKLHRLVRARAGRRQAADGMGPYGDWRRDWPALLDLDLAFGPVIEEFAPDVIHANDIATIAVGARCAARLRARGLRTAWLYDAHEYVAGVQWPDPARAGAFPGVEAEFIGKADAVVTVSPELAGLLRERYRLPAAPLVVGNAPVREAVGAERRGGTSVRTACGLGADDPLLVYSGWVGPERGLDTAVEALGALPGVHLALVCDAERNPALRALLDTATRLGVRERVHVVPYVPQARVPDHLASADLGLICFRHVPNCEVSLPTKVAEYLHAGLPLVSSDVRTVRAFVQEYGVGTVYPAGDAEALAKAVRGALERRATLTRRITGALLEELSWEHQSAGLLTLYERLAGLAPGDLEPRDIPWPGTDERGREAGAPGVTVPDWRPIPAQGAAQHGTRVRLGLGCANYAGQLSGFARALCRARPDLTAEVTMHVSAGPLTGYPADVRLPRGQLGGREVKLDRVNRVLGTYTHYLADAFTPAFGWLNGQHIEDDLPALRGFGVQVALLAHGSDVRDPERHKERYGHSLFHSAPEDVLAVLTRNSARNRRVAAESGLPLFATTPDLLDDLPGARWAPLVVDVEGWACGRPVMERARPVVVHAPSRRWTKGTDQVMPVLEELDRRGRITFRLAEGLPWSQMRELVKDADIVVDQFAIGTYGTFACEGMAAGKPVVAFLDDKVHKAVGAAPPVVNATPETLQVVLEGLLDDRADAARIGAESVEYVRAYHDGRYTAGVLEGFLS